MVTARFFRIGKKPQVGKGRRYYRLISYPCDFQVFTFEADAERYGRERRFAALYYPQNDLWVPFNKPASQCIDWHKKGKGGYVYVQ